MADYLAIFLSASLSILLPMAIIAIRQTVKAQRQEIIKDLEATFGPSDDSNREQIIPSFEFVKFKYFIARPDPQNGTSEKPQDFPVYTLVIASIPLMLVLFCLGIVAFGALLTFVLPGADSLKFIPSFVKDKPETWLIVLVIAYLASYLFIIRELLRAVSNFDLGPTTLLAGAIHVLFGAITAVIIATAASEIIPGGPITTPVLIVAAFTVGFVPELGLRSLLRASRLRLFKRENTDLYTAFVATPIEVIDGIDSEVRSRLAQSHIVSMQNLASANPIMLFVETPYGVYQIIDWVAQAQLCAALGPKGLLELWKMGIRTIFDLERAVFATSTMVLRHEIGKIVVLGRTPEERARLGLGAEDKPSEETDQTVIALVEVLVDDLHIQRLRQIINRISERLGSENLRLGPRSAQPASGTDHPLGRAA
jgi:hypothetical protein